MKIEVTASINLTDDQQARLDMHSFCNILAVVCLEIDFLGHLLGEREAMHVCRVDAHELTHLIDHRAARAEAVRVMPTRLENLLAKVDATIAEATIDQKYLDLVAQSRANIGNVFRIAGVRVREFLARAEAPEKWLPWSAADIRERLVDVLQAMSQNAKGRFGIVFDAEKQGPEDYLFDIDIDGPQQMLTIPPVLLDTLRDLSANARKYTAPGGSIAVTLRQEDARLRVVVRDTGRGIPETEIGRVVQFGYRATNVTAEETKGKGFGLTKAYYVAHQFGGRMWIDSTVGVGTEIVIEIPCPAAA